MGRGRNRCAQKVGTSNSTKGRCTAVGEEVCICRGGGEEQKPAGGIPPRATAASRRRRDAEDPPLATGVSLAVAAARPRTLARRHDRGSRDRGDQIERCWPREDAVSRGPRAQRPPPRRRAGDVEAPLLNSGHPDQTCFKQFLGHENSISTTDHTERRERRIASCSIESQMCQKSGLRQA